MVIIEIIKNQHKKTKAVLFLPKTKRVFNPASLYLSGSVIDYVDYFKSLGVTFSHTMSWDAHVSNISSTLARIVRISSPNRHILPTKTKVTLYDSLFFSHLSYRFLFWADTTVTNVLKLLPVFWIPPPLHVFPPLGRVEETATPPLEVSTYFINVVWPILRGNPPFRATLEISVSEGERKASGGEVIANFYSRHEYIYIAQVYSI